MVGVPWARVVRGIPKPPGWSGKSYACYQLARVACGDVLVFADADVLVAPGVLAALNAVFVDPRIDAVTALPRHTASSWVGRHVLPLQSWVLACFYPFWLTVRWPSALLAAANGQLLAVRRRAYEAIGTHRAVWQSLAEDVELGRRLTAAGFRLRVVDGTDLVRCSAYETLAQVWHGHARNLFTILFRSDALATAVILGLLAGWVVPWVWLGLAIAESGRALTLIGLQLACGLATRLFVARRFGYSLKDTWSHPLLVALLVALVGYSLWAYRHGRIRWRGREYIPQEPSSCTNGPSLEDV
jgi:chlorobactene glucosyltransferase